jgi:hypothetical protein
MTGEPDNITLQQLRLIRADIGTMKDEIDHKLGAMAETLIGIKRGIQTLDTRVGNLDVSVVRIGEDIATITIAVDEHTQRLDRIDKRLGLDEGHH